MHLNAVVRDTLSHNGDNVCKIKLQKAEHDFTARSSCGHAVTLTFKVATQILHATSRLNMVIISVK